MIYLLYGDDQYQKHKYLTKITSKVDKNSIEHFEYNFDNAVELINLCNTNSLFSQKKVIIINNDSLMNKAEQKELMDYLNNPNPQTILIFNLNIVNLDQRKKIYKMIKSKGVVECFNREKDVFKICKEHFNGYHISDQTLHLLLKKTGNNLAIIENESQKLKTFCLDKTINDNDIELVTSQYFQPDIFNLLDAIINQDTKNAIKAYQDIIKYNEDTTKIIVLVANQLRLIYQTKELFESGYSINEIANKLKVHPYRVKLAYQKSYLYNEKQIFKLLLQLLEVDSSIKMGQLNNNIGFELFIYNNI